MLGLLSKVEAGARDGRKNTGISRCKSVAYTCRMGNSDDNVYTIYTRPAPTAPQPRYAGTLRGVLTQARREADGWLDYDMGLRGWEAFVVSTIAYDTRNLCDFLLPVLQMEPKECGLKRESLVRLRNAANVFLSEELREKTSGVEAARRFAKRVLLLTVELETVFGAHLVESR